MLRYGLKNGQAIANLMERYSGTTYDQLFLASKLMTALSWDDYPPVPSFSDFLEEVKGASPEASEAIYSGGLNYFILCQGDSFCASGTVNQELLAVDFEEWDIDIDRSKRIWKDDEVLNELIKDALENLEVELIEGVKTRLAELEVDPATIQGLLENPFV